jgi:hypothetical protein
MKRYRRLLAVVVLTLIATTFAAAQWNSAAPRDGACFYTEINYRGQSFCVDSGQTVDAVPYSFNDRIRSIRVYGGAQVQFYNDSNFGGVSASTSRDISDLRRLPVPDNKSKNWSGRISSIQISGRSGNGHGHNNNGDRNGNGDWNRGHNGNRDGDGDGDRAGDHDRDGYNQNSTVSCTSDGHSGKEWCSTPRRVNSVRLVSEAGRNSCQLDRTFGLSDGRLWVSNGCSGTFEIR